MSECDHCEGGWVKVADVYGEKVHPRPPQEVFDALPDDSAREHLEITTRAIQEAISNSVYPCRVCNEDLFFRWRGGHLESSHNRTTCVICNPKARRAEKSPAMSGWDERADLV